MRLLEYFPKAFIINLPERTDRRAEMEEMLDGFGMSPTAGGLEFFPAVRPPDAGPFPSIGARGCFLSHLEALRHARDAGAERVLVMEDDLELARILGAREAEIVAALQDADWGVVYLGHLLEDLPPSDGPFVRSAVHTIGAHFYGVQQPALNAFIEFLELVLSRPPGHPEGGPMHFDGALYTFRDQKKVATLFATPNLGTQRSSRSDITSKGWRERLPFVPLLRRWKNHWRRARGWA